jgi:elongation factor G
VVSEEIPESVLDLAKEKRTELIEQLAEVDEEIGEKFLNDELPTNDQLAAAIRRSTINLKFSPVFMGSAIKNTGVQPLLDGVCSYLPNPSEAEALAHDTTLPASAPQVALQPAADAPLVGLAFKLEEGRFGQLTYMRVYQGTLKKSGMIFNARTGKKVKVPRLVRMHSNEMEVKISSQLFGVHISYIFPRISIQSALAKSVRCSVWNAPPVIRLRMAPQVTPWYAQVNILCRTL